MGGRCRGQAQTARRAWAVAVVVAATVAAAVAAGPGAEATPADAGYWLLGRDGSVYAFGQAADVGPPTRSGAPAAVDVAGLADGTATIVVDEACGVQPSGPALAALAAALTSATTPTDRCAAIALDAGGTGAWLATASGRVVTAGSARSFGDLRGVALNGPVLDLAVTPTGQGYYLVASDGGVFAFGDAAFAGSMGGRPLNAPVEGLVPDPDGRGYWLVASDGGVFAFDAAFRGSMGGRPLNAPVSAMVPYGDGYLLVARDGGTFVYSSAPFLGSLADRRLSAPIVAVASIGTAAARVLGEAIDAPGSPSPTSVPSPGSPPTTLPMPPRDTSPRTPGTPTLSVSTVVSGLDAPWDIGFLPDGSMLFTERAGRIRMRLPSGELRLLAAPTDVAAAAAGQSGMLGLAVDPFFAQNRYVYTFAASAQPGGAENRVIRWRLDAAGTRLDRDRDIVTGIGYRRTGNVGWHSGGILRFGPDGLLYATVGDTYGFLDTQNPSALAGKVLRFDRDGNPRGAGLAGWNPYVLTMGHRNPQGLAFDPIDGTAFTTEHGWQTNDELTRLRPEGTPDGTRTEPAATTPPCR
jgi:hypothetical protein